MAAGRRRLLRNSAIVVVVLAAVALIGVAQFREDEPVAGQVLDEAMRVGRMASSLPAADEDYFRDMDRGVQLTADEIKGRNNWIVWTGGNDKFWDYMANNAFGVFDLLKTLSSHPALGYSRDDRWRYLGLVNEPCFEKATAPDPDRFGLWLDKRTIGPDCPPDPFANASKYPGIAIGARGTTVPVGSYYGEPSGIVGLRLFPNPDFDDAARARWDPVRFYTDPAYYSDKTLIRPYRVGMSCGFCHVGPSPIKPPADPEHPKWENLTSNPGAQYFWINRIFVWQKEGSGIEQNYAWQLFHTSPPGALDTSFVSTDYINNPRTMNAVYSLVPRVEAATKWGRERLADGSLDNRQFNEYPQTKQLSSLFTPPDQVATPRVLKDGADSVGVLGALNRVYLNIGLFSEEWMLHFRPLIGGQPITPIRIADARRNSSYWNATEEQTPDVALFFLKTAQPDRLAEAVDAAQLADLGKQALAGTAFASHDQMLQRGKTVFADTCARCHSSKVPVEPPNVQAACVGDGASSKYMNCWNTYWEWTKTPQFRQEMEKIVAAPDFLDNNYLSTDRRVPVTLLETNACSPLATNALGGNIWDNFSSQSYKELQSVGAVTVHHPITGEPRQYEMPGGGRGYTRPPSLISVWSTAPLLLNNSVGDFNYDPSVKGRLQSFNSSIEQLLWPEKRKTDRDVVRELGLPESSALNVPGYLYRTTATSYIRLDTGYLPDFLQPLVGVGSRVAPWLFGEGGIEIGPIPKGTPVNLLANVRVISESDNLGERAEHAQKLLSLVTTMTRDLKAIERSTPNAADREAKAREIFLRSDVVDQLLELSKCTDFVVNRGHYFGTDRFSQEPALSDEDKRAVIELLKTF
jgi:hypothetical protein